MGSRREAVAVQVVNNFGRDEFGTREAGKAKAVAAEAPATERWTDCWRSANPWGKAVASVDTCPPDRNRHIPARQTSDPPISAPNLSALSWIVSRHRPVGPVPYADTRPVSHARRAAVVPWRKAKYGVGWIASLTTSAKPR